MSTQECQTEIVEFSTQECQREIVEFSTQECQTEIVEFSTQECQTEIIEVSTRESETERVEFSNQQCQTEMAQYANKECQTERIVVAFTTCQDNQSCKKQRKAKNVSTNLSQIFESLINDAPKFSRDFDNSLFTCDDSDTDSYSDPVSRFLFLISTGIQANHVYCKDILTSSDWMRFEVFQVADRTMIRHI